MPGYAYPVGATTSEYPAKTTTTVINSAEANVTLFTATSKTKVISALATNTSFGILPVRLYVNHGGADKLIARTRTANTNYLIAPLVSGDARVSSFEGEAITEITLQVGDVLKASCPLADKVSVTLNLLEGVK
jgi:hypothetical protein